MYTTVEGDILKLSHLVHVFCHPERHQSNLVLEHVVNKLLIAVGVTFKLACWIVDTIFASVRLYMDVLGHPERSNHLKAVYL